MEIYKILGINPKASKQEISIAFRNKAKILHPDVTGGDLKLEKEFKILNEAYQAALENIDNNKSPFLSNSYKSYEPIIKNSVKEIFLTLEEAINGTLYKIEESNGLCDTCHGAGHIRLKTAKTCSYCSGTGNSAYTQKGPLNIKVVCSHCNGSGKTTIQNCFECHGFGTKSGAGLVIKLPPGSVPGDVFVVENGFSNQEQNIKGNLDLIIALKNHPKYKVHGLDIYMQLVVNVWDLVLGAEKVVLDPGGSEHRLTIKEGTPSGFKTTIKDAGLRQNTYSGDKGNLIVSLVVFIPSGNDPKIKEAYERLQQSLK